MELHQLRYFRAVASLRNFTRAARQEHVSQPSLSQQILKLERELGVKLFDRLGRRVRLTQFGAALAPRAEAILDQVQEAQQAIGEMAGVEKGRVSIGVIPTIAPYFLAPRLADFSREYPRVEVQVAEDITAELLERLRHGTLDLAVMSLPIEGPEFATESLGSEALLLAVPAAHRLAERQGVELTEIDGEPFLLLKEGHCFRENALAACRRAGTRSNVVFETGQFTSILSMVQAGLGVSLVPRMAAEERPGCRFVAVRGPGAARRIGLVRLKRHFVSGAQKRLASFLKKAGAESFGEQGRGGGRNTGR